MHKLHTCNVCQRKQNDVHSKETDIQQFLALGIQEVGLFNRTTDVSRYGAELILDAQMSDQLKFASGAVGYTAAQLRLRGQLYGETNGNVDITLPSPQGAILFVRREALIDTRLEIYKTLGITSLSGNNNTRSLMSAMFRNELNGVLYMAVASFFRNPSAGSIDVDYAVGAHTDGSLRIPFALAA